MKGQKGGGRFAFNPEMFVLTAGKGSQLELKAG